MAGEIKHSWTGTVLTITSDSGTSSCDLKGKQGDRGVRGAQGRAGVIMNADGSVNMSGYATEAYVEDLVASIDTEVSVDLSNYYTKAEIDATLENFQPSGGGGGTGGGSDNSAEITLTNRCDWLSTSISESSTCVVSAAWSSVDGGIATGAGTLTVTIDGIVKLTRSVKQGRFDVDITSYLKTGTNQVKVTVSDVYGNKRSIVYTINVVSLVLESPFDASLAYEGAISYTYTPTGDVKKIMYFILDGKQIGTTTIASSGRQQTFTIPAQEHGAHTFEVYFESTFDTEIVESNHLIYDLICIERGVTTPIIACTVNEITMTQFETITIPYLIYHPTELETKVYLRVDGNLFSELTVDRTQQIWSYRDDEFGERVLSITCGEVTKLITLTVGASDIDVEAVTNKLELFLSSYGRSNNEEHPNNWSYGDINCSFSGYNWVSDGWQLDEDGIAVHRLTGDARLTIPLKMFEKDFRTTGKTIEIEFATKEVRDYDAVILSCMSNNIGFEMTAQKATLKSEQSELFTQYKEDEHIRLTFVVEKRAENRLVYIYLNGIMCGCTQYPTDDDFSQGVPVNISVGSNFCTMDIYNIRVYENNLTRYEVLDNWIADTQILEEKINRYNRNKVYDSYGNIVIANLPKDLPYLVLEAPKLPTYKGNKLDVNGTYTNPIDTDKNFTFKNAQADVQGTSSAGYARKNYKIKMKNGLTQNAQQKDGYAMREDSIPTNTFTFKADVASSEGCNNVELVRLYDRISPYRTPPQLVDSRVRQGIDGFPIVIFHNDGNKTEFIGKYNFNNDKGTPEVFGFAEGDESWEIRNNTSDRVIWKNDDFSGTDWLNDFEGRYPDGYDNPTNLARFSSWVKSTDTTAATNEALAESVTYGDTTYTTDSAEYRLAKFKAEIEDYAELDSALFYYLFTELFLMVDSRAKNAFPSMLGGDKICWLPYDMDTACGINNEGDLVFGYELEDIDTVNGADVYNGQDSVFWINIRNGFYDELQAMYQQLRSDGVLSYDIINDAYEEHQSKWCEAIWNEDAYFKYIEPLLVDGTNIYLPMLQGSKEEQRKWWLYNRFRYMDSKYIAGDSLEEFITLRGYAKSDITITPYADIYAAIKYGSYLVTTRGLRGNSYTLECPLTNVNDTEIYIYSASQLGDVGDLSGLKVGLADFSMATKLQNMKIGDSDSNYSNENLLSLTVGNNILLQSLDVRNCTNFGTGEQKSLDVSGCTNIEHIYATGTALKGISLPNGGILKTLHLPNTVTSLKLCNLTSLEDFQIEGFSNISSLRIENTPYVDSKAALMGMSANGRLRLTDINWTLDSYEEAVEILAKIDTMRGLDENDNNTTSAQISGVITLPVSCYRYVDTWQANYPTVEFRLPHADLNDFTWAEIDEIASYGAAQLLFRVGDEKNDVVPTDEAVVWVILGFNHDDLADGTGKAKISFGLKHCLASTFNWNYKLENKVNDEIKAVAKEVIKTHRDSYFSKGYSVKVTENLKFWKFSVTELLGTGELYQSASIHNSSLSGYDLYDYFNFADGINHCGEQYEYFKQAEVPFEDTLVSETLDGTNTGTFLYAYPEETQNVIYTNSYGRSLNLPTNHGWKNRRITKTKIADETTDISQYWLRDEFYGTGDDKYYYSYVFTGYYADGISYATESGKQYYSPFTNSNNVIFGFCI